MFIYSSQLISNDKFKSVEHIVMASRVGPRVSVACFFSSGLLPSTKFFEPIEELLYEENPPKYRQSQWEIMYPTSIQKGLMAPGSKTSQMPQMTKVCIFDDSGTAWVHIICLTATWKIDSWCSIYVVHLKICMTETYTKLILFYFCNKEIICGCPSYTSSKSA